MDSWILGSFLMVHHLLSLLQMVQIMQFLPAHAYKSHMLLCAHVYMYLCIHLKRLRFVNSMPLPLEPRSSGVSGMSAKIREKIAPKSGDPRFYSRFFV